MAIVVVVALVMAVFGLRLVYLQGIDGPALAKDALDARLVTASTIGERGQITDANGVPLAVSVERYDVAVNQKQVAGYKGNTARAVPAGAAGVAQLLAPILGANPAELGGKLVGTSTYKYIAKGVVPYVARQIKALVLPGVQLAKVADRVYPKGALAGNIVGFVNADGKGAQGLEYSLQSRLAGTNGSDTYEIGRTGQTIPGGYDDATPAVPGSTARLTLLSDVQWKAQEAANAQKAATGADAVTIIVMDARTGDVYAIADSGSIDPNNPGSAASGALSRAASEVFDPGSTGKVVTMAALLENGLATPTSQFSVPDHFTTPNGAGVIKDAEVHGVENLTLTGILAQSSNVGTVTIGQSLSVQQRYDYLAKFGFGTKTGIEMPGESPGILRPADQWDGRTKYNVLFGQGLSVTALQVVGVYGTVANGGVKVSPHLVAGWTAPNGTYAPVTHATGDRVISENTSTQLMTMLQSVVDDGGGTGNKAAIPGYKVAGKTGTAQELSTNGITASFVGVVPADAPRIVVGVFVSNPKTSIYGGTVAAPVFADVAGFTLSELGVAPSDTSSGPALYPTTW
jgi:cell division protein FtsI (penicillin-binding protein 3)